MMSIEDERRYSSQGMAEESASIIVKQQQEIESLRSELSDAKQEASTLAVALHRRHYKEESPQWELLDTVPGIISQIDNMTAGMSETIETLRSELAAEKAKLDIDLVNDPAAWDRLDKALKRGDEWKRRAKAAGLRVGTHKTEIESLRQQLDEEIMLRVTLQKMNQQLVDDKKAWKSLNKYTEEE